MRQLFNFAFETASELSTVAIVGVSATLESSEMEIFSSQARDHLGECVVSSRPAERNHRVVLERSV